MVDLLKGKLAVWLKQNSRIFYLYPIIPMFFLFILCMITSGFVVTGREDYRDCTSSQMLEELLLAILGLTFFLICIYSNLVLELVWKGNESLVYNFYLFMGTLIVNSIVCFIGIWDISISSCTSEHYFYISILNIVVFLVFSFCMAGFIIYSLVISSRGPEQSDVHVVPFRDQSKIQGSKAEEKVAPVTDVSQFVKPPSRETDAKAATGMDSVAQVNDDVDVEDLK